MRMIKPSKHFITVVLWKCIHARLGQNQGSKRFRHRYHRACLKFSLSWKKPKCKLGRGVTLPGNWKNSKRWTVFRQPWAPPGQNRYRNIRLVFATSVWLLRPSMPDRSSAKGARGMQPLSEWTTSSRGQHVSFGLDILTFCNLSMIILLVSLWKLSLVGRCLEDQQTF